MSEIECKGCGMAATPDRLDVGLDEYLCPVYVCPVCGGNMGDVS